MPAVQVDEGYQCQICFKILRKKKCHHFIDIIVWYLLRCPNHIIPRDLKSDIHVTSEGKCLGQNKKIILAPISLTGSGALNGKMLDLGLLKITLGGVFRNFEL